MAIAFDAASNGSTSWSHTCSGADRYLFVYTTTNSAGGVSGVTYNGVAMTKLASRSGDFMNLWGLASPSSGTNTISITGTGAGVAASYTGVSGTGNPEANAGTSSGTTSFLQTSVTTVTNNAWVVGVAMYDVVGQASAAGTGATQRAVRGCTASFWSPGIYDSNGAVTPAGSYSMRVNVTSGSGAMDLYLISIKPSVPTYGALLLAQMVG